MKRLLFLLALMGCGWTSIAQVQHEIFESFKMQERRAVSYYFPENYDETKTYPLVVVLDAEYLFDQVVAISRFYSEFQGMPEVIVAGVYQSKDEQRWDDCAFDESTGLPTDHSSRFFEFLGMELIPYLDTHYSTAPFKVFVGYGITANFGNFYLFKERSLFNAFLSISPLLAPEMESRVAARINEMDQELFYQLIIGGERTESRNAVLQLDRNLSGIDKPNFRYDFYEYTAANEVSVIPYALGKAWDETFKIFKPISPKEYREQILTYEGPVFEYLEKKYKLIDGLFGVDKPTELNDIMAIYAASRKKEDLESLKQLADLAIDEFPSAMIGYYFQGEYFEQKGEPKRALRAFEKAFGMEEIDFLTKEMALEKMEALKRDFGF